MYEVTRYKFTGEYIEGDYCAWLEYEEMCRYDDAIDAMRYMMSDKDSNVTYKVKEV